MSNYFQTVRNEFSRISPSSIRAYLMGKGWREIGSPLESGARSKYSVWEDQKASIRSETPELIVPHNQELIDYTKLVQELIASLESIEGRPWPYIVSDVQLSTFDVIRIILDSSRSSVGQVSLEEAAESLNHAKDLVLAGACAAVRPRPYYSSRKPSQALRFMDRVRLGQSEQGSYVFTLLAPVVPILKSQEQGESVGDSLERRITPLLFSAVRAATTAGEIADIAGSLSPFEEALNLGVSANLCDALAGLGGTRDLERDVEVSFTWAPTRQVDSTIGNRVKIKAQTATIIRQAAAELKAKAPREDFRVVGPVVSVSRAPESLLGEVTMRAKIDDGFRKVSFKVNPAELEIASRALQERGLLVATGRLVKEGRSLLLEDARDFLIPEDGEALDPEW